MASDTAGKNAALASMALNQAVADKIAKADSADTDTTDAAVAALLSQYNSTRLLDQLLLVIESTGAAFAA